MVLVWDVKVSAKLKQTCGPRQANACFVQFRAHRTLMSIHNLFKLDDRQGAPQNSLSMGPPVSHRSLPSPTPVIERFISDSIPSNRIWLHPP